MNFFGMGPMELILILIIALIIFGPGRLPEIMGGIGRAIREFRRMSSEVTRGFNEISAELQGNEPSRDNEVLAQEASPVVFTDAQPVATTDTSEIQSELEAKAVAQAQVLPSAQTAVLDESPKTIVFEPSEGVAMPVESEATAAVAASTVETAFVLREPSPSGEPTPRRKRAARRKKAEAEVRETEN